MRYPTYQTLVTPDRNFEFNTALKDAHIRGGVDIKSQVFAKINGIIQFVEFNSSQFKDCEFLPFDKFVETYIQFQNNLEDYIENLKVGDTVVIEAPRSVIGEDYPYSFIEEMQVLQGRTFKIKEILNLRSSEVLFSNGTDKAFRLECGGGFNWHSSMFELPINDYKIPEKIKIIDIPFDPLKLI